MRPSFYQTFLLHLTSGFRSTAVTVVSIAKALSYKHSGAPLCKKPTEHELMASSWTGTLYPKRLPALISLNFTITVSIFEAINPQTDAGCSNLSPGLYYCVLPTADWNQTTTTTMSSYHTAPAPTPSGTIANCYEWYVVQSGDYCAKIESVYGITMA
ncbi:autolysin [Aspergillus lentulus]|uniref:Autolysin n=1 Tax=Aspergillus lentulus TaxID=293939 RepID=A0ABQ1AJD1_ASPLE|nr:autolysin [Aspergillus lentulus]